MKSAGHIPVSTYRIQLNGKFTFADAEALAGYFGGLGIGELYLSPILSSVPGSKHGYDVTDYSEVNPELGGIAGFKNLVGRLKDAGCGALLDFVPNHMGIAGVVNQWWRDVLEHGPSSRYASFFDIQWKTEASEDHPRILVPVLPDHYGRVLSRGEISLVYESALFIKYGDMLLPVRPESYREVFGGERIGNDKMAEMDGVLSALAEPTTEIPQDKRGLAKPAGRDSEQLKQALAELIEQSSEVAAYVQRRMREVNGNSDSPESFENLHALIERQHYRIARWQAGTHEINYRRFFAIDTLVGLHMENPVVFRECHALLARLLTAGLISGVRIDHIDGLRQPEAYLQRLQSLDRSDKASPLYVLIEKILAPDESVPESWPVAGTTGYEFIAELAGLFVDCTNEAAIDAVYRSYTGENKDYQDIVRRSKRLVISEMFANAVNNLGAELVKIVAYDRNWRDLTRHELTTAVSELAAHFPVYRTYRNGIQPVAPADAVVVERACAEAIADNPRADPQPIEFVRDLIIGRYPPPGAPEELGRRTLAWVLTFQQYSGAIMAKAVEDTAFYNYNRLIALNEVGCDPGSFGGEIEDFHNACLSRKTRAGGSLLASSTHDSKVSEDVRARLYALSEIPEEWSRWLTDWRRIMEIDVSMIEGGAAPDALDQYRFFQVLLGAWPLDEEKVDEDFRERIRFHVQKVVDEAKKHTSILNRNDAYLAACVRFADGLTGSRDFRAAFSEPAARLARLGMVNSLAQLVLKCTVPGVPDFYQGCELWDFSLVDPDNRRPIDYEHRIKSCASAADSSAADLLNTWRDGRIKLRVTRDLLRFRRTNPALFAFGEYRPVKVLGAFADKIVAFERRQEGLALLVVVPRLTAKLGAPPLGAVWDDTRLDGSSVITEWTDVVSGSKHEGRATLMLRDLFSGLPFAVLTSGRTG